MDLLAKLPPVSPSLKSIAPYLQRAEELRKQDPVIAYWCAYYAAQNGIILKTRDAASRNFLSALLDALEQMKSAMGPNDAIHIESASSAYVENFALKVFANADNEDRSSHATRSTAKKFLAAVNFLEILTTFPKSDISESNEEKIRYAKWKAADIAKAFREGRKPAPGPPGWAEEQEELKRLQEQELQKEQQQIPSAPIFPPSDSEFHPALDSTAAPTLSYEKKDNHASPSSNIDSSHLPSSSLRPPNDSLHSYPGWTENPSETWSTVATPAVSEPPNLGINSAKLDWEKVPSNNWSDNAIESVGGEHKAHDKNTSSSGSEVEGQYSPIPSMNILAEPDDKQEHFYLSTINPQPPQPPPQLHLGSVTEHPGSLSAYISPQSPVFSSLPLPSSDLHIDNAFVQQSPSLVYSQLSPPPPPVQADLIELTPGIIAKAQKHCRFAVSALNYDDAEQAKKELRAALALLGG